MFAYCNNNPVCFVDPTGTACCALIDDPQLTNLNIRTYFGGSGGYASGGVSTRGHHVPFKEFFNTSDPEVVFENLEKYGFSFYNGVPVFQADLGNGGAFSFGIIVIDDLYTNNANGINVLNHEYGHYQHMQDIGLFNYTFTAAIPSLFCAGLSYFGISDKTYYSLPWEYTADRYGGVNRSEYTSWARNVGTYYWASTLLLGAH